MSVYVRYLGSIGIWAHIYNIYFIIDFLDLGMK
jgi:hypothetical protein